MSSERPTSQVRVNNTGRVVLVTGGCGGIGHAICKAFQESGAEAVVAVDVVQDGTDLVPPQVEYYQADVSDEAACNASIDWTVNRFGGLDVLVNTAAIQPPASYVPLDQMTSDLWERMVAINLTGYTMMAKAAVRQMLLQRSGVIVNVASEQGHRTARQVPAYGPIKAANIMQAKQWGIEYARHGIRVVSLSPGAIETPLLRASLDAQGGGAELANRHPLGRIGQPFEVANAVLWLASDAASFITATDIAIDGGLGAYGAFADPY
jgi:NAD(P)-dependent dehydrogenase (short-subunit alcohol dehydrogenase family)